MLRLGAEEGQPGLTYTPTIRHCVWVPRLLVSIPPALRGETFSEASADAMQRHLLHSWFAAGLQPVSLNTPSELNAHPRHRFALEAEGIEVLEVPSSSREFPAYLPNLARSIHLAVQRFPGEMLAITNADILFNLHQTTSDMLSRLPKDRFLLAHRCDVSDRSLIQHGAIDRRLVEPRPFLPGIDFVAACSEAFAAALPFLGEDLTIGLPWWDLLLPMALFAAGATCHHLECLEFLHLTHEDRWDVQWLNRIGTSATTHLNSRIAGHKAPVTAFIWSLAFQQLRSPLQSPKVLRSRLKMAVSHLRHGRLCPVYLFDVLRMTEGLVCRTGWPLDQRWISAWHEHPPLQS